jgi:osmotically-inducible protein OsmY
MTARAGRPRRSLPTLLLAVTALVAGLTPADGVEVRKIRPAPPDDATLEDQVKRRLAGRPGFDDSGVAVKVLEGDLVLSGSVETLFERREAERLASAIRGLRSVQNRISVKRSGTGDSQLEYLARRALQASPRLRSFQLKIVVSDARLVLKGEVPLAKDRLEAEKLVSRVPGVLAIDDNLRVAAVYVDPQVVRRRLERLLGYKLVFGGVGDLSVQVTETGVVTLEGVASAHVDRLRAEQIAFGIRGVTSVVNRIRVRLPE